MKVRVNKELEQLKFQFENSKSDVKCVVIIEKKEKQYVQQIMYTNQDYYLQNLPLILTLPMNR